MYCCRGGGTFKREFEPKRKDQVPNAGTEAAKPVPPSVFVNSEPVRKDQVQNAVKFRSHPKVRGSLVIYRCSFLEKKGLTKEEIDEAFRRVPVSGTLALAFSYG